MSDAQQGPGWWQASDGKWYPPESAPGASAPTPPEPHAETPSAQPPATPPSGGFDAPSPMEEPAQFAPPQFEQPQNPQPQFQQPPQGQPPYAQQQYGAPQYAQPYQDPSVPPPLQQSSNSGCSKPLIIGLVIFAVLAVVGAFGCAVLLDNAVDEGVNSLEDFREELDKNVNGVEINERSDPFEVGQEAPMGNGWFVTVLEANLDANEFVAEANEFNDEPSAGNRYVVVRVVVRYDGSGDSSSETVFARVDLSLFGSSNVEHNTFDTSAVLPDSLSTLNEVAGGGEVSGELLFEVGENESDLVLRASPPVGGNIAWLALQ